MFFEAFDRISSFEIVVSEFVTVLLEIISFGENSSYWRDQSPLIVLSPN